MLYTNRMDETSLWASRRKNIYLLGAVLLLSTIAFFVFWQFWYKAPTCDDGIKNGNETGVDCGGSCKFICASGAQSPIVRWDPRLFEPLPGVWSAVVYVENPNTDVDAVYAPYKFSFYGQDNKVIYERSGATVLPKGRTVGVFEGSISLPEGQRPARALFEIDNQRLVWQKNSDNERKISVSHTPILRIESAPRVEANVQNISLSEVKNIELVAVIFDGRDNAIASSRTFIDRLKKDESRSIFFTWPKPFELGSRACSRKSDIALLLDRSGSMASLGKNPPEPLESAKKAASSFVDSLKVEDRVAVVSFATEPSLPHDVALSQDFEAVNLAIENIAIGNSGIQFTNITSALHEGWSALLSSSADENRARVLVLLTDGVANSPKDPNGRTEAEDIAYAEKSALSEASLIKQDGVEIFTIGLGEAVNQNFLTELASLGNNFYFAPTAEDLQSIYQRISSQICKEVPARIEITYKIINA